MAEEPGPLAGTTASLLVSAAFGETGLATELAAWPGLARLIALLQQAATADPALRAALEAVTTAPQDASPVAALAHALATHMGNNTKLRAEVMRLVSEAQQHPTAGKLVTQIAGHSQVEKLVNIGRVGQVHLHLPADPPPPVLNQLPAGVNRPRIFNLPLGLATHFAGRAVALEELRRHLVSQAAAVVAQVHTITGLGGVGKTTLAARYAQVYHADYDIIWWLRAESPTTLMADLTELAGALSLPQSNAAQQSEVVNALRRWLEENGRWLLVLDNAGQFSDLVTVLPKRGNGHILITSRNPHWPEIDPTPLTLDVFDDDNAAQFLLSRAQTGDNETAKELAHVLGCLPIALEQAAAFVVASPLSLGDYLQLFRERQAEMLAKTTSVATRTIAATWSLSIEQACTRHSSAGKLLEFVSFMAPDHIPRSLLLGVDITDGGFGDLLEFAEAAAALQAFSLIRCKDEGQTLSAHRLVQAVVRLGLSRPDRIERATAVADAVLAAMPEDPFDVRSWPLATPLVPHAQQVAEHLMSLPTAEHARAAKLLTQCGRYLRGRGDFVQARTCLEQALSQAQLAYGMEHEFVAWVVNRLASVLRDLGNRELAQELFQRSLEIRRQRLGEDHPDIAWSLNGLGNLAADAGHNEEALELYNEGLRIRQKALPSPHPDIAWSLNAVGECHRRQGNIPAAHRMFEQSLAMQVEAVGEHHPDLTWSLEGLAKCYRDEGNLTIARQFFRRAVTVSERALGQQHPYVARVLSGLITATTDLAEQAILLERLVEVGRANYNANHPKLRQWEKALYDNRNHQEVLDSW